MLTKSWLGSSQLLNVCRWIFYLPHALCPPQYGTTRRKLGRENKKSSARCKVKIEKKMFGLDEEVHRSKTIHLILLDLYLSTIWHHFDECLGTSFIVQ